MRDGSHSYKSSLRGVRKIHFYIISLNVLKSLILFIVCAEHMNFSRACSMEKSSDLIHNTSSLVNFIYLQLSMFSDLDINLQLLLQYPFVSSILSISNPSLGLYPLLTAQL